MSVSQAQFDALELARRETFVSNGQSGDLTFHRYQNGALTAYKVVSAAWDYGDRDYAGNQLPPEVLYELRVHERVLDLAERTYLSAVEHGGVTYQIVRPSPILPTGMNRFWRFWLMPQES